MKISISLLLLVVGNLIYCQEHKQDIDLNLEEVLEELKGISDKLKGYETIQRNQDEIMDKLMELHRDMEHIKGLIRETQQYTRGHELQHLPNVSAADECSEGSHHCGRLGICEDTSFGFTCSCPPGFTWDGSDCADFDECTEGKDDCVPNATCKNSIGSYSCSCNKPFEGDGKTSCEFQCIDRDNFIEGLGCLRLGYMPTTFSDSSEFCQEEGGRLLQHFNSNHLKLIEKVYPVLDAHRKGVRHEFKRRQKNTTRRSCVCNQQNKWDQHILVM
ncbi:uncharacterized protein [Palaemon carinicauda]|uniref:uncharacterized protein n=1 Tax=Palaemon carinicauda TaxID=392227 RepID=UPI0035B57604